MMTMDNKELWNSVLTDVEMSISKANFSTWFKNTHIVRQEDGIVYLGVPNGFVKEWLHNKYHKSILKSLRNSSESVRNVEYVVTKITQKTVEERVPSRELAHPHAPELPLEDLYVNKEDCLNPRYTFGSFVVGPFNEMAHAATQTVLKKPGMAYNPLFIYGKTGVGKTHLIQALGNHIKNENQAKKIYYVTAEKFYLDFINSVQLNKIGAFKEKYRQYDVLIMDDVQYLAGKESTQDELFHLFNSLFDKNKQLVFSSDKHWNLIPSTEERLRSRFGAGLTVDISEPDFESKVVIIQTKARQNSFVLPDEVIEFVSGMGGNSIRELEGVFNMLVCQSQIKSRDLTLAEVKSLLKHNERPKKSLSVDDVVKIVCDFYNIERGHIYEKTRRKEIVKPRQIIMFLLREDFNISFPTIGQKLGGRDHTTVIHSCEKIKGAVKTDTVLSQEVERIRLMF
ncbi:MAG: chromosomal replication initiator protein DnaA [Patescibacteria group bacterium]